jgi:hypothetical protein
MATNKKKDLTFRSMEEFRNRYFLDEPKRKIIVETPDQARALGIEMARETMKELKIKLHKA